MRDIKIKQKSNIKILDKTSIGTQKIKDNLINIKDKANTNTNTKQNETTSSEYAQNRFKDEKDKITQLGIKSTSNLQNNSLQNINKNYNEVKDDVIKIKEKSIQAGRIIKNKLNNNLEELMKTIYQRWFIEFEFPNEEGKPYKSSGGKFVYNNELKQEIPEGWKVKKLSDVNNIFLGGTPNTKNSLYWNGNIKWMNSGEVSNFPVVDTELKITKMGLENSATKYMKKGTVVVSITGNIRTSILAENMCANQSVVGIEENSLLKKSYLYPIMKNMTDYYINISSGNCQKHINKKTLEETLIPIPTSNVLNNYYGLAEPYCNLIINNGITNKKLANQKNFLLPLLMNGQINVDDIEI